jgi:single-stranded-DNA-specific exonuclease
MEKRWHMKTPDNTVVERLRRDLGCHPVIAALLANRGITSPGLASGYLAPGLSDIRPPFAIIDMQPAVRRTAAALRDKEKILILGDYDVDGVTATTLLYEFLKAAGGKVDYHIPHRTREGYGLKPMHVGQLAAANGVSLVITADNGASSHEAAIAARQTGIDLIITDHHESPGRPPDALAVVNPKRAECTAGFQHLAGVGVAFCFLICLRKHLRDMGYWQNRNEPNLKTACDLVALGTVADMVPLVGENRLLTRVGIEVINSGQRPGIRALAEISRIANRPVDSEDIAFRLAPRINAAGRMADAQRAAELLIAADRSSAQRIARDLEQMNTLRQDTEKKLLEDILDSLKASPEQTAAHGLVLAGSGWHEGVLGIVASRLVKRYHRPVVVAAIRDGLARGSARCIEGIDLHQLLSGCGDLLESFGGHAMAAGLTVSTDNLDRFKSRFEADTGKSMAPGLQVPTVTIDCEIGLGDVSAALLDELETMKPFGAGNPEPMFMARNVQVLSSSIVGNHHRRMSLGQSSTSRATPIQGIQFNIDPEQPPEKNLERIAFRLRWNHWNGRKSIQIVVEET